MSFLTPWGYELADDQTMPVLLTSDEYGVYSGGRYAAHMERINAEISAACSAVRNYVGWHLAPSMACTAEMTMQDRRISMVGRDILIQLPAKYVTAVSSVLLGGVSCDFSFQPNGILRCYDVELAGVKRYTKVTVSYTAGLPDELMDPIKELIAHRVTHAVAVPSGITSEASGGVSVTYNAGWINTAQSTTLQDTNKELLAPYVCRGVF